MAQEVKWKTGWQGAIEIRDEKEIINNCTEWQGIVKYNETLKESIVFKIRKILVMFAWHMNSKIKNIYKETKKAEEESILRSAHEEEGKLGSKDRY